MNKKLLLDAEIYYQSKKILSIGGKIKKNFYQFAGIIKFRKKTFLELYRYFKKLSVKTDMTTFLDLSIKNKKVKLFTKKFSSFWYEIDSKKDILVAQNSKYLS